MIDEAKVREIIEDENANSEAYSRKNYGVKNGEEFPELARAVMSIKNIRSMITADVALMIAMTVMNAGSAKEFAEKMKNDQIPDDPLYNHQFLDMLWLGYRLGRRLQREEDQVLNKMEEK